MQIKNSSDIILAEKFSTGNFTIDANPPTGSITLALPLNGAWVSSTPSFYWSATGLTDVTNMAVIVDGAYLIQGLSPTAANSFYQTPDSLALSDGWHTWTDEDYQQETGCKLLKLGQLEWMQHLPHSFP